MSERCTWEVVNTNEVVQQLFIRFTGLLVALIDKGVITKEDYAKGCDIAPDILNGEFADFLQRQNEKGT
jgi:hypothetical protein